TSLYSPEGLKTVRIRTALQMLAAMQEAVQGADIVIMTAAVADYRPATSAEQKMKRSQGQGAAMELVENPDIIGTIQGPFIKIGFAAESQDLIQNARKKLTEKNLAMVAANDITAPGSGFAVDTNKVLLVHRNGEVEDLPMMTKYEVADHILDRAVDYLRQRSQEPVPTA
ncbi:MAG: bifunctional 4'-phosphopantothenoylcysteine decarboxylase/phosphopantothenoylcysteine synthetase, partial [Chloroflexi bacterium]|nr:bifunctional 4'-phosphopantothenoylcysteine decarboxylase/phosphopantothenoylcysteine synthetase [Chloroflexota bacterium]